MSKPFVLIHHHFSSVDHAENICIPRANRVYMQATQVLDNQGSYSPHCNL